MALVLMTYEKGIGVYNEGKEEVKWVESNQVQCIPLADLQTQRGFSFLAKSTEDLSVEIEEMSTGALRERIALLTRVKDTTANKGGYTAKKKKDVALADAIAKAMQLVKERKEKAGG